MNIKLFFLLYFFIIQLIIFKIEANNIKKIRLLHADYAIQNLDDLNWILKGNIIFEHKNYKIKCDNVKYYKNKFLGQGNIHIIYSNNKIELYSKYIEYDINKNLYKIYGNPIFYTKTSQLTGDIIVYNDNIKLFTSFGESCFINDKLKLISDKIEYNYINMTAYYNNGGNIYLNNNIFFSEKGIYLFLDEKIFFQKLYLTNKENTFFSDKVIYFININRLDFLESTLIIQNNNSKNFIYAKNGIHYLNEDITLLKNNYGMIYYDQHIIKGNNILIDNKNNHGYIKNNILLEIINKKEYFIAGYGEINKKLFILINNPFLIKILNNLKLFISSDTLIYKKKIKLYVLYAYNVNTELDNIQISSNYMIYNKNTIKYLNKSQIYFNNKNKIIGNLIRLIINNKGIINSIEIKYNTLFFNKIYKLGILSFNKILGSIINIYFYKNKIKKIIINNKVKILSYDFYQVLKSKKIFSNIDIKNSDKLILYINDAFTKIFFIGNAKSIYLTNKIINNKKLLIILNYFNNNKKINNLSLKEIIIYMNIKNNIKRYIENIKKEF